MTCLEIEVAVASLFKTHYVVPNISFGMGLHECDLLAVTKSGHASEIEIKVSKADLKKDASKKHGHDSRRISFLYFAIPEKLIDCQDLIPQHAGIIVVKMSKRQDWWPEWKKEEPYAELIRSPTRRKEVKHFDEKEMKNFFRLGMLRIWSLKRKLLESKKSFIDKHKQ